MIGAGGVEKVIEIDLDDEAKATSRSAWTRSTNCWWRAKRSMGRWHDRTLRLQHLLLLARAARMLKNFNLCYLEAHNTYIPPRG